MGEYFERLVLPTENRAHVEGRIFWVSRRRGVTIGQRGSWGSWDRMAGRAKPCARSVLTDRQNSGYCKARGTIGVLIEQE